MFTKTGINNIKSSRGSPEPAKRLLLLVSSPLLFVDLAAQLRGGDLAEESSAVHSGKLSIYTHL